MDISPAERAILGALVEHERQRQFGTQSAAYRQARLNAATWKRIETGQSVRGDRLSAAVKLLWPATGGDWRRVSAAAPDHAPEGPVFGGSYSDPDYLSHIERWLTELDARVAAIERAATKETPDGHPAPTIPAGGSPADDAYLSTESTAQLDDAEPPPSPSAQPSTKQTGPGRT